MTIETKYGIGDTVLYVDGGLIAESAIAGIEIRIIPSNVATTTYVMENGDRVKEGGAFATRDELYGYVKGQAKAGS